MKKVYLVFLVLYNCCLSFSQINKIDSIYKALQNKKIDSLYIKSHINLCIYYSKTDLKDSAFSHGWLANKTSIEEKYEFGILKSYQELGLLYFGVGEYDSTIYCFKNVLLKLKNKQSVFYFEATNAIGNSYFYLGDYINAYDYYLKYLRQAQNSGTTKQLAKGNSNVGVILKEQKKYEEALVFFNKTIKIGVENKDNQILFVGYSNKGNIYNEKAKLDTNTKWNLLALENYNKAKSALRFLKKSDFRNSILLLGNIGNVYADLGNYKKSIEEFNEAIELVESNEFFPQSASIYNNVSGVYLDLGNLKMAQKYIKIATDISIESQSYDNLSQSYQNYSRFYELKGDYLNAFKAYKLYKAYNDSTFNTENTEKLKELELKGEFEKKESIKLAEQEKKDA